MRARARSPGLFACCLAYHLHILLNFDPPLSVADFVIVRVCARLVVYRSIAFYRSIGYLATGDNALSIDNMLYMLDTYHIIR